MPSSSSPESICPKQTLADKMSAKNNMIGLSFFIGNSCLINRKAVFDGFHAHDGLAVARRGFEFYAFRRLYRLGVQTIAETR